MLKLTKVLLPCLVAVTLMLQGCNAPATPTADSGMVLTNAVNTAAARLTEQALLLPSATASPTQAPSETPAPPTATAEATNTVPAVTATSAPSMTAGAITPDLASFVADVNYPDDTLVAPGESFEKIWRIKNVGTTVWTTGYSLVCIDAGKIGCPESVSIPSEVKAGETVDIKVKLSAPSDTGTHRAYFRMKNAAGQYFKLDTSGDLWVQIIVGQPAASVTPSPTGEVAPSATTEVTSEPTIEPTNTDTP